jgi:hypothetical protein
MKLQVKQAGSSEELTVHSQKEFLQLYQRGVIVNDDLVLRGDRWVLAGQLPWIQSHAGSVARKTGALPPGAVRALPAR